MSISKKVEKPLNINILWQCLPNYGLGLISGGEPIFVGLQNFQNIQNKTNFARIFALFEEEKCSTGQSGWKDHSHIWNANLWYEIIFVPQIKMSHFPISSTS